MGHLGVGKSDVFRALALRLDSNPIGAPLNETLMQILYILFNEKEALIGSQFPHGLTNIKKLISASGLDEKELTVHLNNMADKGLVIDIPSHKGNIFYALNPLVVGFFEYTFMRVNDNLPMKDLAELFHRYHNEHGVAEEFFGSETKIFRTSPYESLLPDEVETEVLNYEKASEIIRESGGGSLTMCYCRHQASHRGTACDAPIEDVCTSLGSASEWLVRRGFARPASVDELLRVLDKTEKLGLVHLADNVQKKPAFICHCCGCCCGVLSTINKHGISAAQPSNFIPLVNTSQCIGCGACLKSCHINAITIQEKKAVIKTDRCIGCGACIRSCKKSALILIQRMEIYTPPKEKKDQLGLIAKSKGKS